MRVALAQFAASTDPAGNLARVREFATEAAARSAELVVFPEAAMSSFARPRAEAAEPFDGPWAGGVRAIAADLGVTIVAGMFTTTDTPRVRNTLLVTGGAEARYDKLHLFDVTVKAAVEERYAESSTIDPGSQPVVIDSPFGRIGLAVCYDLRFPELFRCMLDQGMEVITLPSAFTAVTGRAHWEVLVRARAVENLSYVIAAGQGGFHVGGRETFGNSMIVDPWGEVLACLAEGEGVVSAELDRERIAEVRRRLPALAHRRADLSGPVER